MRNGIKKLLEMYLSQDFEDQNVAYDDEIRAEADLCAECCSCLRVCCITS